MSTSVPQYSSTGNLLLETAAGLGSMTGTYNNLTNPFVNSATNLVRSGAGLNTDLMTKTNMVQRGLGRFAGSGLFRGTMRALPAIGAVSGVLGAADVLAGPDSASNKIMDGTAMTVGGILGAVGGPLGIAAGAGAGKMVSDASQWIFGDKMSAEERQLAQALAALKGGLV